jgi:hypothetical protein
VPLQDYLAKLGASFRNGYQIGGEARKHKRVPADGLQSFPDLRQAPWASMGFIIDTKALPVFDLPELLHPRDLAIYRAPLLLLRKAIPAEASVARTHRADSDLVYHESFSGVSFSKVGAQGRAIRDYLQILLQSSLYLFCQILTDPQYGVWVDAVHLAATQN